MNSAVYIARQPILTTSGDVFGYELLYRDSWHAQRCVAPDGDKAAAQAAFKKVMPELMRGAAKGVVHKKTVARKLSRLSARIKGIAA